ncbi:MAG: methionine--tRNA ligase [Candidatus Pacebacteria bacterium CG_4_10_14_0_8_um_filter_43_12]|nr:MAG: methionine--tRNA ligase [Candidatus Pacebacteria bacterium CG10_big_fil_rev_8_21_14_0_10_44_11]PIY79433.1 MAG: methionine--tRNA ligase [Candidatus Pacebacteria bacterium CG_4_10_14_0_8_um_filter_43_12]
MKKFYLTAAIPYVNAKPHLGHVLEWFQADVIARFHRQLGESVQFSCGTDENSLKNVQAAAKAGVDPQVWLDQYAQVFQDAFKFFEISLTNFRRGSDQTQHWPGVQELWQRCLDANDIYQKEYTGLYCVGCESYYTQGELIDGQCPEHLTVPETITEKNYFFKLSKYQSQIEELLAADTVAVLSDQYKQEMLSFVRNGLEDFSVSRSISRARGVGVPVPNDSSQVMYVWFDALAIYLTSIGWGYDQQRFESIWPADLHVIGKGIARFHAVYWLGILLSATLSLPKKISVHGYITADGQKMSKSLGNVIDPFKLVEQFGLEPVKFFLLKYINSHSDGDYSQEKFIEAYNADLANGIGNLCSRVAKLCEKDGLSGLSKPQTVFNQDFVKFFDQVELSQALEWLTTQISRADLYLSQEKPWQETDSAKRTQVLEQAVTKILFIAIHLQPFLPHAAERIIAHFTAPTISVFQPSLFPRLGL